MQKQQSNSLDQLLIHLSKNQLTKGKEFEHACKWFLQNDVVYSQQLKRVWLWDEYPGRWGRDKGIDLVAQDYQDKIWAIQVKAYDPNYSVTKQDIDTFLSESNRSIISFRLLITTTNKVSANAREVFAGQEKPARFLLRFDLEKSEIDWMLFVTHAQGKALKIKTPRPHQDQALDVIIKGFEQHDRGQVHMACGTGKSLLGLWLAQKYEAKYTLVLVPSISLVSQLRREWARNRGDFVFDSIFVCSDDTVRHNKDREKDELVDIGFPATTSAQALIEQLNYNDRPKVIFSTYHSSFVIQQACQLQADLQFDLVIADEAHRCVGKVHSDFAIITDDHKIRARRKLYMTATPRMFSSSVKNKLKEYECEIVCMDDEKKFGPVFYSFSFSDAIQQNLLTDYQVVIAVMNHDEYRGYAEKGRFVHFNEHESDARTIASQLLLAKAIQQYDLKKVITFHNGVKAAQDFIETLPQVLQLLPKNNVPTIDYRNVVHGELSQKDREIILDNFNAFDFSGTVVIGNDRCLREGVDIPALDGIVFVDPKNSEVDIIQAVGRAIRLSENKKVGTVIIPVFVDQQSDGVIDIEDSCFKKVWAIIRALRAHDNILAEELDNIRIELGKRSYKTPAKLPSKIIIDVPVAIDHDFAEQLTVKLIDGVVKNCTDSWNERFGELIKFKEEFGHCNVPENYMHNVKLSIWVANNRQKRRQNKLIQSRLNQLDELGFDWNPIDVLWDKNYAKLYQFWLNHGHCKLDEKDLLYAWASRQRHLYKRQRLTIEQINKLIVINFNFDPINNHFEEKLMELVDFKNKEGHCLVPRKYKLNQKLATWVGSQRILYKNNKLSDMRINQLMDIGFDFDPLGTLWENQFSNLKKFYDIHNHLDLKKESSLAKWMVSQRKLYKFKKLSFDQINKLQSLGFDWDPINNYFNTMFMKLDAFQRVYGHCRVPYRYDDNPSLGKWVQNLRLAYKNQRLSNEKIIKLESIGFTWKYEDEMWDKRYLELCEFQKINKHCNVPRNYENRQLEYWVGTQRVSYKKNQISSSQIKKLENIGFIWNCIETHWNNNYLELVKFKRSNGHFIVPRDTAINKRLFTWLNAQRGLYRRKLLSQEKIVVLDEIGFTWDPIDLEKEKRFSELLIFFNLYGHSNVPEGYVDNPQLAIWVQSCRYLYKKNKLGCDQINRLEQFNFVWDPFVEKWNIKFELLKVFQKNHGHTNVSKRCKLNASLGLWVMRQRAIYRKNELSFDKIEKLNSLNFEW